MASLGRLEAIEENLDSLVKALEKVSGREVTRSVGHATEPDIRFEPSRALGDTFSLTELWHELGFDQLRQACRSGKRRIDVEALMCVMVFNRLCDPESKLGVLGWLETVCLPGIETEGIAHQHLLRAMDDLIERRDAVERVLASLRRPFIDQELVVVF